MPCYNPLSGISDKEWASLCCEAKNRMEHELNKVTAAHGVVERASKV